MNEDAQFGRAAVGDESVIGESLPHRLPCAAVDPRLINAGYLTDSFLEYERPCPWAIVTNAVLFLSLGAISVLSQPWQADFPRAGKAIRSIEEHRFKECWWLL